GHPRDDRSGPGVAGTSRDQDGVRGRTMADTEEVFEMITRTRPDDGALARQHRRQQRRRRNERVLVFALAAAIASGVVIGVVATRPMTQQPASSPSAAPVDGPLLVAIDASTGSVLGTIATGVAPFQPDVSPDGSSIAYVKDAEGGHPQIFVSDVDGSHVRQVTGLPGQPGCGCGAIDPDWSPDGTTIAFAGMNLRGGRDIDILDLASGRLTKLTDDATAGEAA